MALPSWYFPPSVVRSNPAWDGGGDHSIGNRLRLCVQFAEVGLEPRSQVVGKQAPVLCHGVDHRPEQGDG